MKLTGKKLISYAVICMMFLGCALCILCIGKDVLWNISSAESEVDWEKLYPFEEDKEEPETKNGEQETGSMRNRFDNLSDLVGKISKKINNISNEFPGYEKILQLKENMKVSWCSAMKDHMESANYGKTERGYYIGLSEKISEAKLEEYAGHVAGLKQFCDSHGTPLLYVDCPSRTCESDVAVEGKDYTNLNKDRYISLLSKKDIQVIDVRKVLHKQGLDHHSLFYNTDHHWNLNAGLWAAHMLGDYLNTNYDIPVNTNVLREERYETKTYKDAMFGSVGHGLLGDAYLGSEDFELRIPEFDTKLNVQNKDKDFDITGPWSEVMYDEEKLLEMQDKGGGYAYATLLGGDRPLTKIVNLKSDNEIRILMLRDSFSLAVAPYLALGVKEIDLIDLRESQGNFTGSVRTYIEETKPDIVIMLYSHEQDSDYR